MVISPFTGTIITAVVTSSVWPILLPKIIEWRGKNKLNLNKAQNKLFKDVSDKCEKCEKNIEELYINVYNFFYELDDMASNSTGTITTQQLRTAIRKYRERIARQKKKSILDNPPKPHLNAKED